MSIPTPSKKKLELLACPHCGYQLAAALGQGCPQDRARMVLAEDLERCGDFPLLGEVIEGYSLLKILGEGGFSQVYLAMEERLERFVAFKVLRPQGRDPHQIRERFFQEAKAIAKLGGKHIVHLLHYGEYHSPRETEGGPLLYMVMEFVHGRTITKAVEEDGPFEIQKVKDLGMQILMGLAEAHKEKILHRDIKPDNIIITNGAIGQAEVKILDFGLAKLLDSSEGGLNTKTGIIMGTPQYLAPDRIMGIKDSPSIDLYSVGLVLFYMIYGHPPFTGSNDLAILHAQAKSDLPTMHNISPELREFISTSLNKNPEDRFPSATSMFDALKNTNIFEIKTGMDTRVCDPTTAHAKLILTSGDRKGRTYLLFEDRTRVGRVDQNEISISHSSISKYHAYIDSHSDDSYTVLDLRSSNGTLVLGKKCEPSIHLPSLRRAVPLQFGYQKALLIRLEDGQEIQDPPPPRWLIFATVLLLGGLLFALW